MVNFIGKRGSFLHMYYIRGCLWFLKCFVIRTFFLENNIIKICLKLLKFPIKPLTACEIYWLYPVLPRASLS